jgi:hypothetical protein
VGAFCLAGMRASAVVASITRLRFQRLASVLVTAGMAIWGEWPLRVDGFGSHPVDGAVDGGSSDAEQFGELSLGVIP